MANQVSCNQIAGFGAINPTQTSEESVFSTPQCPISKSQCEQLLAFLNSQSVGEITQHSTSASQQPASLIATGASTSQPLALSASTSNYLNNFSSKAFCSSSITVPNSTIFIAEVVNRSAFDKIDWIIDIRATDHMIHSVLVFSSITWVSNSFVYLPNGEKVLVTHIGTVHLTKTLILTDVLCVPSFIFNLMSISKLNKSQYFYLIFLGSFCFIQDLTL